ncbi:MAG TPA: DUF6582 domain-containing protein [Streptosporangiaceae bacterium]|nr:DUF6582 domain-containing protein [Streptosporangiaceae bacterium]
MAKAIATLGGVALEPGVSRNRRWYTAEHIAGAVAEARKRLARGDQPMVMLSHHEAGDDSLRIAAALRKVSLTDDGRIRWEADIPDTETGRQIAALADTSDGKPAFLEGVSIRGRWTGRVQKVRAPDGDFAEQGQGLLIDGLDFTHKPGVPGARIDAFSWAKDGASETDDRVLITESVQEARVTVITEETSPAIGESAPEGVREALRAVFGESVTEAATPAVSKRGPGLSDDGGRVYADPGYQKDKKQRYDISTKAKAKAAYAYSSQPGNAKLYTPAQLKRVKGRIKAALGKFGVTVAAEGWTIDPAVLLTEALVEFYGGDPDCCGSYSLSATNGPTTVTVCSYGLDPADLQVILAQACKGAGMALSALDPDMDGDVDVDGEDPGESAPGPEEPAAETEQADPAVTETAPTEDPAPDPAADREGTEEPAMSEPTTETVAPAPAAATAVIPQDIMAEAIRKAAKKAAKRALAASGTAPAESAAAPAAAAAVTETEDERVGRIVSERLAAERAAAAVTETDEARINRLVEERLVRERQEITASGGGPARKGLVAEHAGSGASSGEIPADFPMKNGAMIPTEEWTDDQRRAVGVQLERHVLGSRASS